MIRLALLATLLVWAGFYLGALLALPLAFRIGHRHAIRKTGVGMVRGGTHRILTGRL